MGALTPPPPLHRSQRSTFLLTNDLKQSDLIIFFKSYSLENSERVNKPHASQKMCFYLYVTALKRGIGMPTRHLPLANMSLPPSFCP